MLMTPITPKVMARPIAASSNTEPSESPYQAFCSGAPESQDCPGSWRWLTPPPGAPPGGRSAGSPSMRPSASWSPRSRITAIAAILSSALGSAEVRTIAARASVRAFLTRAICLLLERLVDSGQRAGVARLEHGLRCVEAPAGSFAIRVSEPSAASSMPRRRLLRRMFPASAGGDATGWPVAASVSLSDLSLMKTRFVPAE